MENEAGCLELRVETGRWEWLTVAGVQRMAPRWARLCPLCFLEVEDAEHALLRRSAYDHLRKPFLLESGLTGGLERAAAEVLSGGARTREGAVELDDELGGGAAGHAFP